MNIYLGPSGYNFFWQIGVLDTIGDHVEINDVYCISGGTIAYGYYKSKTDKKTIYDFWEYSCKSIRTYDYFLKNLQKQMTADANVNVGATTLKGFRWNSFNYSENDTWHNAMASCNIPFVNIIPSKHIFKHGVDGGISFSERNIEKENLISINAYENFCEVRSNISVVRQKSHVPLILKKNRSDFIKSYEQGLKDGEAVLKGHVLK